MDVRLDGPDRALDDQTNADRRRQVKDHVALVDQLGDRRTVVHALDRIVEARILPEVADVVDAARGEVVEDVDLIAARQAHVGQVGPDETRAACDQNTHEEWSPAVGSLSTRWLTPKGSASRN